MDEARITRRHSLVKLGGAAATAIVGWRVVEAADDAHGAGPAAVASGAVSCVLAPEQTEGPYYLPGDKLRRNVTEGKPGVPLTLKLTVLDASTCKPIKGAAVDIWHCDAGGIYSGTSQQGAEKLTFLRGIQKTDAKGLATFKTIYPGWYQGRTVHIHVRVLARRQHRSHRPALLSGHAHGHGLQALAVQLASWPRPAQQRGQHLSQRRQPLDAEAPQGRHRLYRLDLDGRPPLLTGGARRFDCRIAAWPSKRCRLT
jgi:protocatechuate 3,4-dioxygenase beta subunit